MALSIEHKSRLAELDVPSNATVRAQLEHFFAYSGYTIQDLVNSIGYSRAAVMHFRSGKRSDPAQRMKLCPEPERLHGDGTQHACRDYTTRVPPCRGKPARR
jgi:hypothetical protein